MNYLVPTGEKPVNETYGQDGLMRRRSGIFDDRVVEIRDARPDVGALSLEREGFELADHPTAVRDFYDVDELRRVYYPEMQRLIAERSGARRVHVFDHTLRTSDEAVRLAKKIREPVKSVHNDYTEWSGPQRVRDLLPDEAEALIGRRFAVIQVWRAINQPIERNPLAIVDARSIAPDDLIAAERRFPDRVGEIYQLRYNPVLPVDLVPAHAPRRSPGLQGLRQRQGRPRPLGRPHLLRRPRHLTERRPPRKHRDSRVRVFLGDPQEPAHPGGSRDPGGGWRRKHDGHEGHYGRRARRVRGV